MKRLRATDFGPIRQADVKFGDLTVLVGPQASGKSLFVQLYKLIEDAPAIADELARHGFAWRDEKDAVGAFSSLYFGGGLEGIVGKTTRILRDERRVPPEKLAKPQTKAGSGTTFLIPAQRVLVLQDGWPKPFMAYGMREPYAIRSFSESIRQLMTQLNAREIQEMIVLPEINRVIDAAIYSGSVLSVNREDMRQQIVLKHSATSTGLPFSVWSAGQREFTPLLLGLYASKLDWAEDNIQTVIIEEPEMGLHPQAIVALGLLILELLGFHIRVILSTHSPVFLDLLWAIRELSGLELKIATDALGRIFGLQKLSDRMRVLLATALKKSYRTYFFNRTPAGVVTEDISTLDPDDDNENIAGWGGLSGFSGRIAQIVGEACSR